MYIVKASYFKRDSAGRLVGVAILKEYEAETLKAAMDEWRAERENHDLARNSPLLIYDVINTEE